MTRVAIVDDQAMIRDGLRLILELGGVEVVGEAENGQDGVALVRATAPDVVLMDIQMPVMDGIEATRAIIKDGLASKVLVLTTFNLDAHVYEALRAGASGFLLKDVSSQQLLDAVARAASGETPMAGSVLARLIDHFVVRPPADAHAERDALRATLSDREMDVLRLVGVGRSNAEIAEQLTISMATVKTHIRHLFAKLDLRDRVQAVVLAHETGLVERPSGR